MLLYNLCIFHILLIDILFSLLNLLVCVCVIVDSLGTDFSVKKVVLTLPLAIAITLIVVLTWHIWALLSLSILGLLLLLARLPLLQRVPKMRLHH